MFYKLFMVFKQLGKLVDHILSGLKPPGYSVHIVLMNIPDKTLLLFLKHYKNNNPVVFLLMFIMG